MTWEVDNDDHSFKNHPPHTTSSHFSFVSSNPSSLLSSHFLSHSYPMSLSLSGVWSQFINAKKWARCISTFIIFPFPSTYSSFTFCVTHRLFASDDYHDKVFLISVLFVLSGLWRLSLQNHLLIKLATESWSAVTDLKPVGKHFPLG